MRGGEAQLAATSPLRRITTGVVDRGDLAALCDAMARAFAVGLADDLRESYPGRAPGAVLALFEDATAASAQLERYVSLASAGATVVLGAPGATDLCPPPPADAAIAREPPVCLDTSACDALVGAWALVALCGSFTGALVATPWCPPEPSTVGHARAVRYHARWSVRCGDVLDATRQLLRPLRPLLEPRVTAGFAAASERASAQERPSACAPLLELIEALGERLVRGRPDLNTRPAPRGDLD